MPRTTWRVLIRFRISTTCERDTRLCRWRLCSRCCRPCLTAPASVHIEGADLDRAAQPRRRRQDDSSRSGRGYRTERAAYDDDRQAQCSGQAASRPDRDRSWQRACRTSPGLCAERWDRPADRTHAVPGTSTVRQDAFATVSEYAARSPAKHVLAILCLSAVTARTRRTSPRLRSDSM